MLRIFHLSDLHIGKVYNDYPENIRALLRKQRFLSLKNIVGLANDKDADLFVLAGDIFDKLRASKDEILKLTEILKGFTKLVLVLPGNHDYYSGNEELWRIFKENINENILVLNEFRPFDLKDYGYDVVVYPAYCQSKHSETNNLAWIREEEIDRTRFNMGLAHGAIEGLSADAEGKYFTMTREELMALPMDLWLLGHTHVPYPLEGSKSEDRIFNAGVHEPDGMHYPYEGSCFLIEASKEDIYYERLITGKYRFEDSKIEIEGSLEKSIKKYCQANENTLLRITLSGYVEEDEYKNRQEIYNRLKEDVLYLDIRDEELKIRLSPEDISKKYVHGSFPYRMLHKLTQDEDKLQIAYDMIEESRKK